MDYKGGTCLSSAATRRCVAETRANSPSAVGAALSALFVFSTAKAPAYTAKRSALDFTVTPEVGILLRIVGSKCARELYQISAAHKSKVVKCTCISVCAAACSRTKCILLRARELQLLWRIKQRFIYAGVIFLILKQ